MGNLSLPRRDDARNLRSPSPPLLVSPQRSRLLIFCYDPYLYTGDLEELGLKRKKRRRRRRIRSEMFARHPRSRLLYLAGSFDCNSSCRCKFYAVVYEFLQVSRLHINWLAPLAKNLTVVFHDWRGGTFFRLPRGRFLLLEIIITKFLIGLAILGGVDDNCLSFTFPSIYYSIYLSVGKN